MIAARSFKCVIGDHTVKAGIISNLVLQIYVAPKT